MPAMMLSTEIRLLAYTALLSLVLWIPYIVAVLQTRGLVRAMGYPTGDYQDLPAWAQRAYRAHMNLIENLVPFAALVLALHVTGQLDAVTALGARLFFWARLVQVVVHIAGVPWVRTLAFAVGWIGNLILVWQLIT